MANLVQVKSLRDLRKLAQNFGKDIVYGGDKGSLEAGYNPHKKNEEHTDEEKQLNRLKFNDYRTFHHDVYGKNYGMVDKVDNKYHPKSLMGKYKDRDYDSESFYSKDVRNGTGIKPKDTKLDKVYKNIKEVNEKQKEQEEQI